MRMLASIQFDREIDRNEHYISPGGYEMTFSNGATTAFDFLDYWGTIDNRDKTILNCEMRSLDTESFEESEFLRTFAGSVVQINEFFVYTGEYDEPEIHPVKLVSLDIFNDNGERINVGNAIINSCMFN